jgi:ribonuclease BN (tRNA processing enzyme)
MKIRFLGVGSAFADATYYQSNMFVTTAAGRHLLFDCGGDIRFSLAEAGIPARAIDAVYLSHLHSDHIGGLEWLCILRYFSPGTPRPVLLCEAAQMQRLWHHALRAGLEYLDDTSQTLDDYFDCRPLSLGQPFVWERLHAEMYKLPHVVARTGEHPSFGLVLRDGANGEAACISSDTCFCPAWLMSIADRVTSIFHDCETDVHPTGVHARYQELLTLPQAVRAKMWLYHYQANPPFDALADGFRGFVTKGQEFHFAPGTTP